MINRKVFLVFGLALVSLMVLSNAYASDFDQATKFTFSQSVQIPGQVLPAGTYWFVVPSQGIVQIYNQDWSRHYATVLTRSAEQLEPSDKTEVTLAERGTMQPGAIVSWFYPGRIDGQEFVYSRQDRKEIAQAKQRTVVSGD
jgi:hypothetical protein